MTDRTIDPHNLGDAQTAYNLGMRTLITLVTQHCERLSRGDDTTASAARIDEAMIAFGLSSRTLHETLIDRVTYLVTKYQIESFDAGAILDRMTLIDERMADLHTRMVSLDERLMSLTERMADVLDRMVPPTGGVA